MRKQYEMTDAQYTKIMEASSPVTYMVVGGIEPMSPQENANRAWKELGDELGFEYMSAQPSEKGRKFFTAVPKDQ